MDRLLDDAEDRGDWMHGETISVEIGQGALGAGAVLGAARGVSDLLAVRSWRMGPLSFFSAWVTYRSNSASVAWRKTAFWSASGNLENIATSLGVPIMRATPGECSRPGARSELGSWAIGRVMLRPWF
jgi:hypothetical protein